MKPWNCAIIGIGSIAQSHLRALQQIPSASVTAVCSRDADKTVKLLQPLGLGEVPIFNHVGEMCRDADFDVLHICTPSGAHLEPALAAIARGKHVVIEKPLEITLARVDQILDAARAKGTRVAGIFQNRWNPANIAIKQAMDAGRFGRVAWAGALAPWYRTDEYYAQGGWRGTWALDGGGAVMNQGIHQVDLMRWIMGPVKTVSALASSRIHDRIEVEDTLTASLQFESGAFGTFMSTTAMFPGGPARFEVGGEGGTAVNENGLKTFAFRKPLPDDPALLAAHAPGAGSAAGANPADIALHWMVKNIESILDAWSRGLEAPTSGVESRKAIAIVRAMYDSANAAGVPIHLA